MTDDHDLLAALEAEMTDDLHHQLVEFAAFFGEHSDAALAFLQRAVVDDWPAGSEPPLLDPQPEDPRLIVDIHYTLAAWADLPEPIRVGLRGRFDAQARFGADWDLAILHWTRALERHGLAPTAGLDDARALAVGLAGWDTFTDRDGYARTWAAAHNTHHEGEQA